VKQLASLKEGYEEHVRDLGPWQVQIVIYRLGSKFICIVNNLDPNATVCRVSADTRLEAIRRALREASCLLAKTTLCDLAPPTDAGPPSLTKLVYCDGPSSSSYDVGGFLAVSLEERMRMILSGKLTFIGLDDATIRPETAMVLLGKAAAVAPALAAAA
jgi:hypothetical protein